MMDPGTLTIGGVTLAVIVVALLQVAKITGLPARLAPLTAIILGVAAGWVTAATGNTDLATGLIGGLLAGLAAVGLYSGTKNTAGR